MTTAKLQAYRPRSYLKGVALLVMVFGVVTVVSGGSVLFGTDAVREMAGRFVPFVVWFNFCAGFFYIAVGLAIWLGHRWALGLSVAIVMATALVATVFGILVIKGGAYEMRTAGALALRLWLWVAIALIVLRARRSS